MSGPDDLLGLVFLSGFRTPSLLISMAGIGGYGCPSGCGMLAPSYRVNEDSYCLLSIFDLYSGSACIFQVQLNCCLSVGILYKARIFSVSQGVVHNSHLLLLSNFLHTVSKPGALPSELYPSCFCSGCL